MNSDLKEKREAKILRGIIAATVILIWVQSALPGPVSSSESGWVLNLVRPILGLFIGEANVNMHLVRKLAHFTEYFVLGVELALYFKEKNREWYKNALTAMACGLGVAAIDESIQLFAISRGPSVVDVLIDFSGVVAAVIVVVGIQLLRKKYQ